MFDYATLRVIWWVLLGFLLAGFAVTDGFDLGIAAMLPFTARKDEERRVVLNTIGPVWEGNQVWIILGAGAIFAAWPAVYAVSFSGFYLAMFLLLATFIIRPVGFKYRSKMPSKTWRATWDWSISIAAILSCVIFGVAVGNVIQGVPFHFNIMIRAFYTGTLWQLFNPFAILCGLVSLSMLVMHGSAFLSLKTEGVIQKRAKKFSVFASMLTAALFATGGIWIQKIWGYVITSPVHTEAPSNPLHKEVIRHLGAWLNNYHQYHWMIAAPLLGFLGIALLWIFIKRFPFLALIASALSVFSIVCTVGLAMFPFILPSSTNPSQSLTVWDASSSHITLVIMLFSTVIFMPLILAYTSWVYWVLRGKVTVEDINNEPQSY